MHRLCPVLAFLGLTVFASAALDPAAFSAAVELYQQRKPEAQAAFAQLAAANPENADIQFYLGRLALQRGDHEEAVKHLEKAVALAPNDSRMHHRLGDAYGLSAQKAGLFSKMSVAGKCRTAYEKAVALGLPPNELSGALIGLGSMLRTLGQLERSAEVLRSGKAQFPDNAEFDAFLALTLHASGKHADALQLALNTLCDTTDDPGLTAYQRAIRHAAGRLK